MIAEFFRKVLGITTPAEDFERGVKYVREQIAAHGRDNAYEMTRLWHECSPSFDNSQFDKGMVSELLQQNIPDPMDWN